jgi:hypothetical protein
MIGAKYRGKPWALGALVTSMKLIVARTICGDSGSQGLVVAYRRERTTDFQAAL